MNYVIENELVKVEISDNGAELQSIILKSDNCEYLWQGDEKYWSGRAYNLFPICGRLVDGKYTYKGKTYEMNLHGFARNSVFSVNKISDTEIDFTLVPNDEIKAQYPFDFVLVVKYSVNGTEVATHFEVKNTGDDEMIFAIGGHPGFNVPLTDGDVFEDYYLEFDDVTPIEKYIFTPFFNTGKTEPYALKDGKILELTHSLFDDDAKFFTNISRAVTLKSKKSTKAVRVEYPEMQNIGFWHKNESDAPYVCIEPWCSIPSRDGEICKFETKDQMTHLESGKTYTNCFKIIIK